MSSGPKPLKFSRIFLDASCSSVIFRALAAEHSFSAGVGQLLRFVPSTEIHGCMDTANGIASKCVKREFVEQAWTFLDAQRGAKFQKVWIG